MNMSLPFSGLKSKLIKKTKKALLAVCFMLAWLTLEREDGGDITIRNVG
jgi:hypothetical protein